MLDPASHHRLDRRLLELLRLLDNGADRPTTAAHAEGIIGSIASTKKGDGLDNKLLRHTWQDTWRTDGWVVDGWFGDVRQDKTAKALHAVFTEMARYLLDSDCPSERKENAGRLSQALRKYLERRGCEPTGSESAPSTSSWASAPTSTLPAPLESGEAKTASLSPSRLKAMGQYLDAVRKCPHLKGDTDQAVYDWVAEHSDGDPLPPFATWSRYLRGARQATGTGKNTSRSGRTGRSVVGPDDI
jgi:hypothetical protein